MSKQEKFVFHSRHDQLTIMRSPQEVPRSVNGIMQIIKEDKPPFKFENGNLVVYSKEDAKELRDHRLFNVKFHEIPASVQRVADKKAEQLKKQQSKAPEKEGDAGQNGQAPESDEVQTTVVEGVSSFNEAMNYFKDELGAEHKDVNSKEKIAGLTEKYAIEFPNYDLDDEETDD